jgi:hypothetical protein
MKKILLGLILLIAVAGAIIGWGQFHNASAPGNDMSATTTTDVKTLVSYTLPSGWTESSCPDDSHVYVAPADAAADCAADPIAAVSMLVDPRETKDCAHVTAPTGVLSHTCKSLFINGLKTLLASTKYPKSDLYPKAETVTDYFVDTGKGIVQVERVAGIDGADTYKADFEQLVQSIKIR